MTARRVVEIGLVVLAALLAVAMLSRQPHGPGPTVGPFWIFLGALWGVVAALDALILLGMRMLRVGRVVYFGLNLLVGGAASLASIALARRLDGETLVLAGGACWLALLVVHVGLFSLGPDRSQLRPAGAR